MRPVLKQERLQKIIDLAHSDRSNPMSEALIEMIDAYFIAITDLRHCEKELGEKDKEKGERHG